jgi:hypothetical protein
MKKNLFVKNSIFYFIIFFFTVIIIEFFFRIGFSVLKNDKRFLIYGFSNYKIISHSFINLDFYIFSDNYKFNYDLNKSNKKDYTIKKKIIWVFGGSTTRGLYCNNNSSSWPNLLKLGNDYQVYNYAKNNVDSDFSTNLLISLLQSKKEKPDLILFSDKFNEKNILSFGFERNQDKLKNKTIENHTNLLIYFIQSLKLTLKNKLLSVYFIDEFIIRINKRLQFFKDAPSHKIYSKNELNLMEQNYRINLKDIIKILKIQNNIKFYIISLPTKNDFNQKNKIDFYNSYNYFDESIKRIFLELKNEYNMLYLIDIPKIVQSNHRYRIIDAETLFCDDFHQLYKGNQIISEIILNNLN